MKHWQRTLGVVVERLLEACPFHERRLERSCLIDSLNLCGDSLAQQERRLRGAQRLGCGWCCWLAMRLVKVAMR